MFTPPTCLSRTREERNRIGSQGIGPIYNNGCPANAMSGAWLGPQLEWSCYGCNPFGILFNDKVGDGCYKWQFKIQCNDENKNFVKNAWNPDLPQNCGTLGITCNSITGERVTLKEGPNKCVYGGTTVGSFRGYDIQGHFIN